MRNIIIAVVVTFLATTTVYAASNVIRTEKKWGEVKATSQTTEVYQLRDFENGVICYFGYLKGNANTPPVVSCVK